MRSKKALKNTIIGFIYEIAAIICAFIVPRLILTTFGSTYNGITSAIAQFLSLINLLKAGVGGVTMAALYKPLAEKDIYRISVIIRTTEVFLRKVSALFLAFLALFAMFYPFLYQNEFEWFFTASLVAIMGLSTFAQHSFGIAHQILLCADQRQSFIKSLGIVLVIVNTVISVLLVKLGFGIRAVKLGSAVLYVIAPIFIIIYSRNKYNIIKGVSIDNTTIEQRWDNFGKQLANFTCANKDIVILSFFVSTLEISVYAVYRMVCTGILHIFNPLVNGIEAAFGNMFAKGETDSIEMNLRLFEQLVFVSVTFLFSVSAALIVPFVMIYTKGVTDVEYQRIIFALIFITSTMFQCCSLPYESLTNAVGHFKQTRKASFFEVGMNIILSLLLVSKFGIVGVIIGTLFANIFRTVYYALYMSKHVIKRSILIFSKRLIISICNILLIMLISRVLPISEINDYLSWIINAVILSLIALTIVFTAELLFYKEDVKRLLAMLKRTIKWGK